MRHLPYDSWLVTAIQSLRGDMRGAMRDVFVIAVVVVAVLASGREGFDNIVYTTKCHFKCINYATFMAYVIKSVCNCGMFVIHNKI